MPAAPPAPHALRITLLAYGGTLTVVLVCVSTNRVPMRTSKLVVEGRCVVRPMPSNATVPSWGVFAAAATSTCSTTGSLAVNVSVAGDVWRFERPGRPFTVTSTMSENVAPRVMWIVMSNPSPGSAVT